MEKIALLQFLKSGLSRANCKCAIVGWVGMKHNVLALGAVADFGAKNCQYTTKFDVR